MKYKKQKKIKERAEPCPTSTPMLKKEEKKLFHRY